MGRGNCESITTNTMSSMHTNVFVCFVCLFVCCHKSQKSLLRLPPWPRSKTPGSIPIRAEYVFLWSYPRYTTSQKSTEVNTLQVDRMVRIPGFTQTLYRRILSHQKASPDPPRLIPLSTNTQGSLVP